MTQAVLSESFSYESVDCIVRCDGGLSSDNNTAILGWEVLEAETSIVIAEGRAMSQHASSTLDAECTAVAVAISELLDRGVKSIIIQTDFDGFVTHFKETNSTDIPTVSDLRPLLQQLESWSFEKRSRDEITRAHQLASSAVQSNQEYVPKVTLDKVIKP